MSEYPRCAKHDYGLLHGKCRMCEIELEQAWETVHRQIKDPDRFMADVRALVEQCEQILKLGYGPENWVHECLDAPLAALKFVGRVWVMSDDLKECLRMANAALEGFQLLDPKIRWSVEEAITELNRLEKAVQDRDEALKGLTEQSRECRLKLARLEAVAEAADEVADDLRKYAGEKYCQNACDGLETGCNRCWPCVIWKAINKLDAAKGGGDVPDS